jgi:hypothetical protein
VAGRLGVARGLGVQSDHIRRLPLAAAHCLAAALVLILQAPDAVEADRA